MLSLRPSGTFDTFQPELGTPEASPEPKRQHLASWLQSKGIDAVDPQTLSEKEYGYAMVHFQLDTILQQLCNLETESK